MSNNISEVKIKDIKFWGHNCFSVSNKFTTLLIDPWFSNSGAFYSSWFQYPKNHHLKPSVLDLLSININSFIFISHEHQDHFDEDFLNDVPKNITIIIPNYLDKDFRDQISKNFKHVVELKDNEKYSLDDEISILLFIKDVGINHDSSILVKSKNFVFFNQNDCKIFDQLYRIKEKIDFYSVQFSGANWHPSNFNFSDKKKKNISSEKVNAKFKNVLKALNILNPKYFIPAAGPAIFPFLDAELSLGKNNIFVHQSELKKFLEDNQFKNTLFLKPSESFDSHSTEPIMTPSIKDINSYRIGLKNKWVDIPNEFERFVLEEHIHKRFSKILDINIKNCPILVFNYGNLFNDNDHTTKNKIFIDIANKKILEEFDYSSSYEEIVSTEQYFHLMCYERWQNVYLTLRAKVFREPDIFNNDLNIFLFSDYSNIRYGFLTTHNIEKERIDVKSENGDCFRIDRYCPHQKSDLCNAEITEDNILICPVHAWKFDLNNEGIDKRSNLSINSRKLKKK
tara:strand:- start:389 stop:1918 length:1530 start_codon:yes stop_codon:yes gene_type:complete